MKINLNSLSTELNRLINSDFYHKIDLLICENGTFCFRLGVRQYYLSQPGMLKILEINGVGTSNTPLVYSVLSRHIINQLRKPFEKLRFPEIKCVDSIILRSGIQL